MTSSPGILSRLVTCKSVQLVHTPCLDSEWPQGMCERCLLAPAQPGDYQFQLGFHCQKMDWGGESGRR